MQDYKFPAKKVWIFVIIVQMSDQVLAMASEEKIFKFILNSAINLSQERLQQSSEEEEFFCTNDIRHMSRPASTHCCYHI